MSPMADANLSVQATGVYVTNDLVNFGMTEDAVVAIELNITNAGAEPFALSAAAISCWMELSRDQPAETRSLIAAAGGEGAFPTNAASQDLTLGSTTVAPGQTRLSWVLFRGY